MGGGVPSAKVGGGVKGRKGEGSGPGRKDGISTRRSGLGEKPLGEVKFAWICDGFDLIPRSTLSLHCMSSKGSERD